MAKGDRRSRLLRRKRLLAAILVVALVSISGYLVLSQSHQGGGNREKPIILYVNQGNGVVNGSGFGMMLDYAASRGFNTVFFQVYRQGVLLFSPHILSGFVNQTHQDQLKIFFALYLTNSSQEFPAKIYGLNEDGITLDMSSLDQSSQASLLAKLKSTYSGETAVTTTDMNSPLKPDLLVLETYDTGAQQYIHHGIIASVGVYLTKSLSDYQSQFQYALQNSDGVMVFDYARLVQRKY